MYHDDIYKIGSDEDTVGSCVSVHPIPPKKDFTTWNRYGELSVKYYTKFVPYRGTPVHVTNEGRKFVLSYYFADGEIAINEVLGATATGFGNKFLQKRRLENWPAIEKEKCDEMGRGRGKIYYDWRDFKIGAYIEVNGLAMEITGVDSKS